LRRLRERLPADPAYAAERRRIFSTLIDSPLLEYLRTRQADQVDRLLAATIGTEVSLASLGMELRDA
jgi:hypothetical protein